MSKKSMMNRIASAALTVSLAACGSSSAAASSAPASSAVSASSTVYKVAIVKQLDHASLDEIANAITAEFDRLAAENGVTIDYGEVYSGQNDATTLQQIGSQAISDKVDVIIPIATLAAQTMTVAAQDTKTPVVFAAISDPDSADLSGLDYVTGTSDALNTDQIMDMILMANPDAKKIGLLYSQSEANSTKPIAQAKAYLDAKGIAYAEATANTNDEVITAASTLISDGVDAVFTPDRQCDYGSGTCDCPDVCGCWNPSLHRCRFLCAQRCVRNLRRQLYGPGNGNGGSCLYRNDAGHRCDRLCRLL